MISFASLERSDLKALGLCALNLALAAGTLTVVLWPAEKGGSAAAPTAAPSERASTIQPSFAAPPIPLFGRNNIAHQLEMPKPPPPVVAAAPAPVSLPETRELQWRVTGIIIAKAAAPLALIERSGQPSETRRIVVGDEIDGWRVEHIAARAVSFRRGATAVSAALDPPS